MAESSDLMLLGCKRGLVLHSQLTTANWGCQGMSTLLRSNSEHQRHFICSAMASDIYPEQYDLEPCAAFECEEAFRQELVAVRYAFVLAVK